MKYNIEIKRGGEDFDYVVSELLKRRFIFSSNRYKTLDEIHQNWGTDYKNWLYISIGTDFQCKMVLHAGTSKYYTRITLEDFLNIDYV